MTILFLLANVVTACKECFSSVVHQPVEITSAESTLIGQINRDVGTLEINNDKFKNWTDILVIDDPEKLTNIKLCDPADPKQSYSKNRAKMAACISTSIPPMLRTMEYISDQTAKASIN